ncbi:MULTISPECIES: cupin domain-containing protein [Arcobacteraceae]|uniref:cupin domain-containing protein n=1 Tax=Arcobacteraceae TaxID=2808963 RepID=UPI00215A0689|nr:cupin domain-containing protein [Arcobacter sp. F155]
MLSNIFKDIKIDNENEQFIDLLKHENVRIERIVSNGQCSPIDFWYEQEENEFVLLLKGQAILEFENKEVILKEGDFINIPSKQKHRVKYTSKKIPTIWLAIFYNN